jgi:predicted metal-dependent peptidase
MNTKPIDTLVKAKAALVIDHPFFAALLLQMPMIEDSKIKTMATNGEKIWYNPDFAKSLSLQEMTFVLAHEVMHSVFQHMYRRGARNHNRWNIAGDYVINDILAKEKVGIAPKGVLLDANIVAAGKGTAEGVYGILPEETEGKGTGESGGSLDDVMDGASDPAQAAQKEAEMRVKVVQAANAAKMCGKLSAGLVRHVKDLTRSRTDWKSILRRFLTERAKTELSYARPKRRFLGEDIILPSQCGEKMGAIMVGVDCSGSIDEKMLNTFAGEIRGIVQDVMPGMTHVVYFDSAVVKTEDFGPEDNIALKPVGGGGTAFSPIFKHASDKGLEIVACVILTDLCCDDFGPAPGYPVLWASTMDGEAPFGEVLLIKE